MSVESLELKSARYDRLSRSVLIDGRSVVVEISHEALEALARRELKPHEAVNRAVAEARRLTMLAMRVPADDGKVHITERMVLNDGRPDREENP